MKQENAVEAFNAGRPETVQITLEDKIRDTA